MALVRDHEQPVVVVIDSCITQWVVAALCGDLDAAATLALDVLDQVPSAPPQWSHIA